MKRQLLTCCLAICSLATMAQHDEWKNPEINAGKPCTDAHQLLCLLFK